MPKKTDTTTPGYISALLQPRPERTADRRSWSIPVFGVWVPFFTATNTEGQIRISAEGLGAPVRLAREKDSDGSVKFSKSGRPVLKLVKELGDQVKLVRENFQAGLISYAENVQKAMPDAYKAQAETARKKGEVIYQMDARVLAEALEVAEKAEAEPTRDAEPVAVPA
jgi:hypothetical protein